MTDQFTDIWREYQRGLEYLNGQGLYTRVEECVNFTNGDQWKGLKSGSERPSQLNILNPILKNSTALVGQNTMSIHYSSMNFGENRKLLCDVCDRLNLHAARTWERLKLDRIQWDVLQDAFICGDSLLYFYERDGDIAMEVLDTTNIMYADEQNPDIQEQPYLLIIQRRYVEDVKKEAKLNGISKSEIDLIQADNDTQYQVNGKVEVKNDKKLISIMKLWKEDGSVYIARSTKNVVYQKKTQIEGMTLYPIAKYSWKVLKGTARGMGDIWDKVPNQISINKSLYRFESSVKASAFPHKVYDARALDAEDIKKLSYPDSNIAVNDFSGQGVNNLIGYLQPANISSHARDFWQDLITLTRELSGAGDNLENINPEEASGAAINAARDAKALNVNMQVAAFRQFIEDIALIWYDLWVTYSPNGLEIIATDEQTGEDRLEVIPQEILRELKIDVRIDVSPNNPYSKAAQDMGLRELFQMGAITFEEYVEALDDDSSMPKGKLEEILEKRKAVENKQMAYKIAELAGAVEELQAENQALKGQAQGGAQAANKLIELTNAMQGGATTQGGIREETPTQAGAQIGGGEVGL